MIVVNGKVVNIIMNAECRRRYRHEQRRFRYNGIECILKAIVIIGKFGYHYIMSCVRHMDYKKCIQREGKI